MVCPVWDFVPLLYYLVSILANQTKVNLQTLTCAEFSLQRDNAILQDKCPRFASVLNLFHFYIAYILLTKQVFQQAYWASIYSNSCFQG